MKREEQVTQCASGHEKVFGKRPEGLVSVPGRINLIGEHTDYTKGLSLPMAINRWTVIAYSKRHDEKIKVYSKSFSLYECSVEDLEGPLPQALWQKYIYGALSLFHKSHGLKNGCSLYIESSIPLGKGLSSSASLELCVLHSLNKLYQSALSDLDLVYLSQKIEHQFLGLQSGLLDQFGCHYSKPHYFQMVDFETLKHEYFKLPPNNNQFSWVLVDSKGARSLAEGEYQKRVNQCHEALMILKQQRQASSYRTITMENLKGLREWPLLLKRIRHMVEENDRAKKAKKFLIEGSFDKLGRLLNQSHESLGNLYEVSTSKLDFLQEEALRRGSYGSRMLGGGFGGCTLNLVPKEKAKLFCQEMMTCFHQRFGAKTESLILETVGGTSFH